MTFRNPTRFLLSQFAICVALGTTCLPALAGKDGAPSGTVEMNRPEEPVAPAGQDAGAAAVAPAPEAAAPAAPADAAAPTAAAPAETAPAAAPTEAKEDLPWWRRIFQ